MKKYLVPLLVLVLLLVSVTAAFADPPTDTLPKSYTAQGTCWVYLTDFCNDLGFAFDKGTDHVTNGCVRNGDPAIYLKEKGKLSPFTFRESGWECHVRGETSVFCNPYGCFPRPTLDEIILTKEITTP